MCPCSRGANEYYLYVSQLVRLGHTCIISELGFMANVRGMGLIMKPRAAV